MKRLPFLTVILGACLCPFIAFAFNAPSNDGFVTIDSSLSIITKQQEAELETALTQYQAQTSNEIAVLFLKTLDGADCIQSATDIGREWRVGDSRKNNGIFILAGYDDRTLCIATGYGLEGAVPDITAKGIIDTDIRPAFRNGEYYQGLVSAVDSLQKHIGGEYTAERYSAADDFSWVGMMLFLAFFFMEWIIAILERVKGWWLGGVFGGVGGYVLALAEQMWIAIPVLVVVGLLLDYFVSKHYKKNGRRSKWWAGGSWGPSSSRGSSSRFGGGSFGGGGASGGW